MELLKRIREMGINTHIKKSTILTLTEDLLRFPIKSSQRKVIISYKIPPGCSIARRSGSWVLVVRGSIWVIGYSSW